MIFSVVVLSPHGYFGQANVLGMPDTGGQVRMQVPRAMYNLHAMMHNGVRVVIIHNDWQVVYILDQVRALEAEMLQRNTLAGLDDLSSHIVVVTRLIPDARGTTCNQRIERIMGCQHARILRVPFRTANGRMPDALALVLCIVKHACWILSMYLLQM